VHRHYARFEEEVELKKRPPSEQQLDGGPAPVGALSRRELFGLRRRGYVRAAVALLPILGFVGAHRLFFSVANQGQLIIRNSHGNQELLDGVRAAIAQSQAVFLRAALIVPDRLHPVALLTSMFLHGDGCTFSETSSRGPNRRVFCDSEKLCASFSSFWASPDSQPPPARPGGSDAQHPSLGSPRSLSNL
jgi:hypothetical protein